MGNPEGEIRPLHSLCERRRDAALLGDLRHRHLHAEEGAPHGQRLSQHHRVHPLHVLEQPRQSWSSHHDHGGVCVLHDAHRRKRRLRQHRDQAALHHQEPLRARLYCLPSRQGRLDGDHVCGRPRRSLPCAHGTRACRARHEQEGDCRGLRDLGRRLHGAPRRVDRRLRQGLRTLDSRLRLHLQDPGRASDRSRDGHRARLLAALSRPQGRLDSL